MKKASQIQRNTEPAQKTDSDPQAKHSPSTSFEAPVSAIAWQDTLNRSRTGQPESVMRLQRALGNQAVSRMLQRKMTVGAAHDPFEQEADRVAHQVMSAPASPVMRAAEEDELQAKPLSASITRLVQRDPAPEEDEIQTQRLVQREPALEEDEIQTQRLAQREPAPEEDEIQARADPQGAFEPGAGFEDRLAAQKSGGGPLPNGTRQLMEARFGAEFGAVRVHSDSGSAQLNREVQAQAFTQGGDIFMGAGKYAPGTSAGDELLAHELTHTIQQGAARTLVQSRKAAPLQRLVQRYPANALDDGATINWAGETLTAERSASGKTGVWFFKGISGPVNDLVVKPEYHGSMSPMKHPSSASLAGSLLSSLQIPNPKMRNVMADSPDGQQLQQVASAKGAPIPLMPADDIEALRGEMITRDQAETLTWITIMGRVGGRSIEGAAKEAGGDPTTLKINRLLNQLQSAELLRKIGQLIVLDAFAGNVDRIGSDFANLGNIMYEGQNIIAIDSDAKFAEAMKRGQLDDTFLGDISRLFSNPGQYSNMFIEGVRSWVVAEAHKLPADQDPQHLIDYFNSYPDFPRWRVQILQGIQEGIQKLRRLLETKKSRQGLKSQFENWKGLGSITAEWDTLRIRQKMIELRSQFPGLSEAELQARLLAYAQYRQKRSSRAFGLKWTAKFF